MNKSYVKGARFERQVAEYLRNKGFMVVRSAGSRFPDLIAIRDGMVLAIEVRLRRDFFDNDTINRLLELSKQYRIRVAIAYREHGDVVVRVLH